MAALLLLLPSAAVRAQTSETAFLPESDSYVRVTSNIRLVFDAKGYLEDGDLNRAQIGPSLQFNIRPLEKLKQMTIHDMDDMKPMPVVFAIGYFVDAVHAFARHHRVPWIIVIRTCPTFPRQSHSLGILGRSSNLHWSNPGGHRTLAKDERFRTCCTAARR